VPLLPTVKTEINCKLSDQVILIYGRPKVGKSTFCSYFDDALFIATEPGLNHLEVFKVSCNSWEKVIEACAEIAKGEHKFKTIVIDTLDNLITYCAEYVCKEAGADYIGDIPHGKGWSMVTNEIKRVLVKLSNMSYGLVMVSHCQQEEIETKTRKYNRWTINVSGKNRDVILAIPDIILFMDSDMKSGEEVGIIRTKPSIFWEAGDKSNRLPDGLEYPMKNPKVAYDKIVEAFKTK
jgi:hypothetical protein